MQIEMLVTQINFSWKILIAVFYFDTFQEKLGAYQYCQRDDFE
jgi:hypothetical protein